jgi:hypothetical protein
LNSIPPLNEVVASSSKLPNIDGVYSLNGQLTERTSFLLSADPI